VTTNHLPLELQRPEVHAAITRAITTAYDVNVERHDPGVGDDRMTFGQHCWKSGSYYLKREFDELPEGRAEYNNQSLDINIGRAKLRLHKLGESEEDDPRHAFPDHPGPAARLGPEQLELQLVSPDGEPRHYFGWVIGTYGNHEDGCRAIRLHAVGSERALDGTINHWEDIVTLYDASRDTSVPMPFSPSEPDVVVSPEPVVALHEPGEKEKDAEDQRSQP
jgi:hypothetical protein